MDDAAGRADGAANEPWVTVPNLVCLLRLVGSAVMVVVAWRGHGTAAAWLATVLLLTDWVDGKLAAWLDQRTERGAVIDAVVDKLLYLALVPTAWFLRPDFLERWWIVVLAAVAGWLPSVAVMLARFRRVPSFHTRLSKTCWLLMTVGVILLLSGVGDWPLLVALGAVTLAGLEATAIAVVIPEPRSDVPSLLHARDPTRRET